MSKKQSDLMDNEKPERELLDWMLDKTTVNELKFCKYFVESHPLIPILENNIDKSPEK